MCLQKLTAGGCRARNLPKGDRLSLDCGTTERSAFVDPVKQTEIEVGGC